MAAYVIQRYKNTCLDERTQKTLIGIRASPFLVDVIRWYNFAILIEVPLWFELPWFVPVLLTVVELPQIEEDLQQRYRWIAA